MIFVLGLGFAGIGSGIRRGEGSQLQFLPLHKKSLSVSGSEECVLESVCARIFFLIDREEIRRGLRPKTFVSQ